MSIIQQYSIADLSGLYQTAYGGFETDQANWDSSELLAKVNQNKKFVGNQLNMGHMFSSGGGSSSGSLPSSAAPAVSQPVITAKSVYATSTIDNQSMQAARQSGNNLGAFEDATKLSAEMLKVNFRESVARQFFGDSTGHLGTVSAVTTNASGNYTCTISNATWLQENFKENDLLNFGTDTELFLLTPEPDVANKKITVARQSGIYVPKVGDKVYTQKSKDNEMTGLKGICDLAAGASAYGLTKSYRWSATVTDAGGAGPSVGLFREFDQAMRLKARGVLPTDYIMSHTQMRLFENAVDAKSIIQIPPSPGQNIEAGSTTAGVMINGRVVKLSWSPYIEEARIYAINRNKISYEMRPNNTGAEGMGGYLLNGDSIFFPLHVSGTPTDAYAMFYASYGDLWFAPPFVGCIDTLATS